MKKVILIVSIAVLNFYNYSVGQSKDISKVGPLTEQVDLTKYNNVLYISQTNGSDKEGDGTQSKPWDTIIYALNKITDNSKSNRTALLVAEGRYKGGTIQMKSFIDIFGGFQAESWKRDIYNHSTIIDGDYSRRVVIGADDARIDGVTITQGISHSEGGGILCDDTSPEISNCFIVDNYTLEPEDFNHTRIHQKGNEGGGIACLYNAIPLIRNNVFFKNRTSIGNGGAISFYGWVRERHIKDNRIENNFLEGTGRAEVYNNVFVQNTAGVNDFNGTRSSNGGAISCSSESRPIIENNVIVMNRAKGNSDGGGIYVENFSYPTINNNWIVGNVSDDDGGGIYVMRMSHAVISNNFIAGNWTIRDGVGGIRLSKEGRALISNNVIVYNQSGGGVQCVDSYVELKDNIIMHNCGKTSVCYSNKFNYFIPSIIEDNIILENEGKIKLELRKEELISTKNNNTKETLNGKGNTYKPIPFDDVLIMLKIKNYSFDEGKYRTAIETDLINNDKSLVGRVIMIENFWSVIQQVSNGKLYVWGNISRHISNVSELTVLPLYKN